MLYYIVLMYIVELYPLELFLRNFLQAANGVAFIIVDNCIFWQNMCVFECVAHPRWTCRSVFLRWLVQNLLDPRIRRVYGLRSTHETVVGCLKSPCRHSIDLSCFSWSLRWQDPNSPILLFKNNCFNLLWKKSDRWPGIFLLSQKSSYPRPRQKYKII